MIKRTIEQFYIPEGALLLIKISGAYIILVDKTHETQIIKKINEFEESLEFFFATNKEEECYHELHELFKFIARNGTALKIKGLQTADVVLPPRDVTFEELKELWTIRRRESKD